jgi:hypothetical protein
MFETGGGSLIAGRWLNKNCTQAETVERYLEPSP